MGRGISAVEQTGQRVGNCCFQAVANVITQLITGAFARYNRVQQEFLIQWNLLILSSSHRRRDPSHVRLNLEWHWAAARRWLPGASVLPIFSKSVIKDLLALE